MKVLLVCAVGMSSSALAEKVRNRVHERKITDIKIGACGSNQVDEYADQADLILIAPQIAYIQKKLNKDNINNVVVMNTEDYGTQNVDRIIEQIRHPNQFDNSAHEKHGFLYKFAEAIGTNRFLLAIRDGLSDVLPVTVVGALFSLLKSFPLTAWTDFIQATGIIDYFEIGYNMTIGMLSVYLSLTVSYHVAKSNKRNGTGVGLTSLICFLLLTGAVADGKIDLTYFGARGMFTSIITAILIGELFCLIDKKTSFRPGSGMPKNIGESFRSLVPAFGCIIFILFVSALIAQTTYHTIPATMDAIIIKSVASIAGTSALSYLGINLLSSVLWFFGLHGGQITGTITNPIYMQLAMENLSAFENGQQLPYMIVKNINLLFTFGGAGSTLSLSLMMLLFAKSKKLKSLGKISFPMGVFFINEPVIFGLPIMLNPIFFLPFILIPLISGGLTFLSMSIGLIPYMIGYEVPWTTPPIIFGLLEGGIPLALWQVAMFSLQFCMWYPFFHYFDKRELTIEKSYNAR